MRCVLENILVLLHHVFGDTGENTHLIHQEFIDILDAPPKADEELRKFLAAKSPWD